MTFGEKIQKLRKEKGISQEALSFQLQVSRQAISKWENDKGYPETEKIIKMSEVFQVTLDYLLSDAAYPNENSIKSETGFYVSQEMATDYLLNETLKYRKMAWAIALLLAGVAFVFLFNEVGILLYLIVMIVSIALFVSILLDRRPYSQLNRKPLSFDQSFKKELFTIYIERRKKYHTLILVSIVLFCISFLALPFVGLELFKSGEDLVLAISMVLSGAAVYLFTYLLGILRSYQCLIKSEDMTEGKENA